MALETVTIPKREYETLKKQAHLDMDFLRQIMGSLKNIKEGKVRRVY